MRCEHFGRCGGCAYLDMPYEEELAVKEKALKECLGEHGRLVKGVRPSPAAEGYRNKMELAFGDEGQGGPLALGIRKRRSYYEVAGVENCALIPGDFKRIARYVLDYFRAAGETFFHRRRHTGSLRHLVLRRGAFTGELLVNLSAAPALQAPLAPLVQGLLALHLAPDAAFRHSQPPSRGRIVGVLHSVNGGVADAVKNENVRLLWGRGYYNEEICGLKFKVAAHAFFQTNSAAAEVLYGIVREYCAGAPAAPLAPSLAYDLYCGTGAIAQLVSPYFGQVTGIELAEEAVLSARENARLNSVANCDFRAGDVLRLLKEEPPRRPAVIIVDPPRDGLHPKALPLIAALAAPRLIYVACKPKSLARDLAGLAEAGYTPTKIDAVDMFPRTPHVETVVLLQRHDT